MSVKFAGFTREPFIESTVDWSSCANIERVTFFQYSNISDVRCFLDKPKYLLKSVDVNVDKYSEDWEEIISLFAGGTGGLEKLILRCPEPSLGLFNKLVERNKKLNTVHIYFDAVIPDEKTMDVLRTFLKCPCLKKMKLDSFRPARDIDPISTVKNLCHSHRHRRVCISAFGNTYLK